MDSHDGWRTRPMYSIPRAARLVGMPSITIRRWLYGMEKDQASMRPVFGTLAKAKELSAEVSFIQLAEIAVARHFRNRRIKLERVRRAHEFARAHFQLQYPFAEMDFKVVAVSILTEFQQEEPGPSLLMSVDPVGQLALPLDVAEELDHFEYIDALAARWYPLGQSALVVIDPQVGAGLPTVSGRRIPVDTIYGRWKAGENIGFIASDFKLKGAEVETVLRYAEKLAA